MAGRRAESLSQRVSSSELLQVVSSLSKTASRIASSSAVTLREEPWHPLIVRWNHVPVVMLVLQARVDQRPSSKTSLNHPASKIS
jgi:hypothetical protein